MCVRKEEKHNDLKSRLTSSLSNEKEREESEGDG